VSKPIAVLIADDHEMFADSLASWLRGAPDIGVVEVVDNSEAAVRQAVAGRPDVVLLDIDMPGLPCFDAARIITQHCPNCAILFVSAHTHDHYIERALAVEAAGYVTKTEPPQSVLDAIRAAVSGGAYFSPEVQSRIIVDAEGARLAEPVRTRLSLLTARELDTLRYLARGMSKKRVAEKLGISVKTVETHTANLMDKLGIHNRVELALFAVREGLANA
jgi:two-component system response regulator NreC